MNPAAFSSLHLKAPMLKNLASLGYAEMTPVQALACLGRNRIKGRFFKVRKTG